MAGTLLRYTASLRNDGDGPARDASLEVALPVGAKVAPDSGGTVATGHLSWKVGEIAVGAKRDVAFGLTLPAGDATVEATVRAAYLTSARSPAIATAVVRAGSPSLEIVVPGTVDVGEVFTVACEVTNTGGAPLFDVKIRADLPRGLVTEDDRSKVSLAVGTLTPGARHPAKVRCKPVAGGSYTITARVEGAGAAAESKPQTLLVRAPKLVVGLKGPAEEVAGRPVVYTATVTNAGDGAASGAKLVVTLPAGAVLVPGPGAVAKGSQVHWTLDHIAAGSVKEVTFAVRLAHGDATLTASCQPSSGSTPARWKTKVKPPPPPKIKLSISGPDLVATGTHAVFTVTVENVDSGAASVDVNVRVPKGATYSPAKGSARTENGFTYSLSNVAPGAHDKRAFSVHVTRDVEVDVHTSTGDQDAHHTALRSLDREALRSTFEEIRDHAAGDFAGIIGEFKRSIGATDVYRVLIDLPGLGEATLFAGRGTRVSVRLYSGPNGKVARERFDFGVALLRRVLGRRWKADASAREVEFERNEGERVRIYREFGGGTHDVRISFYADE